MKTAASPGNPIAIQAGRPWPLGVDTARPSPEDIAEAGKERSLESAIYSVKDRSVVALRKKRA